MADFDTEATEGKLDRILRLPEVLQIFGGSKSSLERSEGRGETPKRFHPWEGSPAVAWWESEWIERQKRLKRKRRAVV